MFAVTRKRRRRTRSARRSGTETGGRTGTAAETKENVPPVKRRRAKTRSETENASQTARKETSRYDHYILFVVEMYFENLKQNPEIKIPNSLHWFLTSLQLWPQVTRDYDEEEQGYDSEKEVEDDDDERKSDSDSASSPKGPEELERSEGPVPKKSKQNGDDHHQEDMEMSD